MIFILFRACKTNQYVCCIFRIDIFNCCKLESGNFLFLWKPISSSKCYTLSVPLVKVLKEDGTCTQTCTCVSWYDLLNLHVPGRIFSVSSFINISVGTPTSQRTQHLQVPKMLASFIIYFLNLLFCWAAMNETIT